MRTIFMLSKQDLELSNAEIEELFKVKTRTIIPELVEADIEAEDSSLLPRLAYTRQASELMFSCSEKDFEKNIASCGFPFRSFKGKYAVEMINPEKKRTDLSGKDVGSLLWNRFKNPKVDLENPDVLFDVFVAKITAKDDSVKDDSVKDDSVKDDSVKDDSVKDNGVLFCRRLFSSDDDFESRKAHKRPELHPSSMHPKLARCIVNLSGARKEIIDPLCGSGGILIEAGLCGLRAVGVDIDAKLLRFAEKNLEGYGLLDFKLVQHDSTKLSSFIDTAESVVTDFPYGLHSKAPKELVSFYGELLKGFSHITKRAVVVMPDFVDAHAILKKTKWRIKREFDYYVHKSLTRIILVLER